MDPMTQIPGDVGFEGTASLDCPLCPRLMAFREDLRRSEPDWFNSPVPSFGPGNARILVVGLAPGMKGANRTGRPFTGDYAGDLLYATLLKFGFAQGHYDRRPDDGFTLQDVRVANAVRCLPPENKPVGAEVKACNPFLQSEIAAMQNLQIILCLGGLAHGAVLTTLNLKKKDHPFGHGSCYALPVKENDGRALTLLSSYHCSRYNTSTGRLTTEMFEDVVRKAQDILL